MAVGLARVYGGDKAVMAMVFFSRKRRSEQESAQRIYGACLAAARRPALFLAAGVPDTLQGRFEMLALVLFPVLHRLVHDPGDDPELARLVSESMVEDMDAVFREIGVSDPSVPKRMKLLYGSFAGRVAAYGKALAGGEEALIAAIERNVFPEEAPPAAGARMLAAHLATATRAIAATDLAAIRRGEIPFPEIALESGAVQAG